jgi:hypothetical protein
MGILNEPVEILTEGLRAGYKEPARTGLSKRHTTTSDNFTATAGQTDFTVTKTSLLCVNYVTQNTVTLKKYIHYNIDVRNNKIILVTGATLNDAIVINYDYNTSTVSWIFERLPESQSKLTRNDYPRIVVTEMNGPSEYMGLGSTSTLDTFTFQIDIITKDGIEATNYIRIDNDGTSNTVTENNQNRRLVRVLSRGIKNFVRRNLYNDLGAVFSLPPRDIILEDTPILFEEDKDIFRRSLVISLRGKNLGERE